MSLLCFFTVMVALGVLEGRSLHPVHYFFLAAAFFAFHLLLAYLVDHLDVHASFAVAAGYTGLTLAVGAVVTLFVLMQLTARVDWEEALGTRTVPRPPVRA